MCSVDNTAAKLRNWATFDPCAAGITIIGCCGLLNQSCQWNFNGLTGDWATWDPCTADLEVLVQRFGKFLVGNTDNVKRCANIWTLSYYACLLHVFYDINNSSCLKQIDTLLSPIHSVVFAWKIYTARRDWYLIDFKFIFIF